MGDSESKKDPQSFLPGRWIGRKRRLERKFKERQLGFPQRDIESSKYKLKT